MKTLGFLLAPCLVLGLASTARAESYVNMADPSGAAMCFDASGNKAALSACESSTQVSYQSVKDPSGVSMCFSSQDEKAPLSKCEVRLAPAPQATKPGAFFAMLSFFL